MTDCLKPFSSAISLPRTKYATRSLVFFCQTALSQRSVLFTSLSNSISLQLTPELPLGIKASHIFFAFVQRLGPRAGEGHNSTARHTTKKAWSPGFDPGHQETKSKNQTKATISIGKSCRTFHFLTVG